ncbi:MAG: molybdopterin-dependent oxidoreductase [Nitrososphaerota archaeon]|nr:molybdopterin-dependent oxidoreductase [Candidatus Geocrenenecus dongiae]
MKLPPNQKIAKKWNVYAVLGYPEISIDKWRIHISGLVKKTLELSLDELYSMKMMRIEGGFHCVEGWSIVDVVWEGVKIRDLAERAGYDEKSMWVLFKGLDGYSAPAPVDYVLEEDSIIALKMNGKPIPYEHGYPARPIIPKLYAWKSVKWLKEIEFREDYVDGYWEERGYHQRGDVWLEERRRK